MLKLSLNSTAISLLALMAASAANAETNLETKNPDNNATLEEAIAYCLSTEEAGKEISEASFLGLVSPDFMASVTTEEARSTSPNQQNAFFNVFPGTLSVLTAKEVEERLVAHFKTPDNFDAIDCSGYARALSALNTPTSQ